MSYEPEEGEEEEPELQKSSNETGGYSIVVMPMCDAANIDLFPQHA